MDENIFFREATLRICGNLDIEVALFECLEYLKKVIPADSANFSVWESDIKAIRVIARATGSGGKKTDHLIPMPPIARKNMDDMQKGFTSSSWPDTDIVNDPSVSPGLKEISKYFELEDSPAMHLVLETIDRPLCSILVFGQSNSVFTEQDAKVLDLLKRPLSVAMSNALKHRSELKLFGRDFFWEVTKRICGNLEIEKSMFSALQYLSQMMPASRMFLEHYDASNNSTRTIGIANLEKGKCVDLLTPLSPEAQKWATRYQKGLLKGVYVYTDPGSRPYASMMMKFHKVTLSSVILLPLESGGEVIGSLILGSEGDEMFTQEHADLISQLSGPFAIAMSNNLKHRNELRLFNRDFFWEVTKRICGNLKIEEGLRDCLEHISQYIPADSLYLERYDNNLNAMRVIARANADKAEVMDMLIPLPKEAKDAMDKMKEAFFKGTIPLVIVVNEPNQEPVTRNLLQKLGEPSSSAMSLPLFIEGQVAGTLVVLAEGDNRFDEHHEKLFATLKMPFFVAMSNTLKHREVQGLKDLLADDNRYLQGELRRLSGDEIIGANFGLKDVMHKVQQVAALNSPVLLLGETGVGKDVIANTIHYSSSRSKGPFVSVNCGAIPDTLIDSELFGHEKGAFTGALSQKRGRFERANKGTIFLDEIGELPLLAQVRLLKVLQSKEIERVGGVKTIPLDIRIIAATNRNLEEMVKLNEFREDLWFRLNVFPIWIPPLRDRKEDLPALLQHFINQKAKELNLPTIPVLSPGAIDSLMDYHWPGNVREIENIVERALILNPSGPLIFYNLLQGHIKGSKEPLAEPTVIGNLEDVISQHIRQVLLKTKGKVHGPDGAATILEINPSTLRNRMNKLGIDYGRKSKF